MARAKRTNRAEARRRYRATLAEDSLPGDLEEELDAGEEPTPGRRSARPTPNRAEASRAPAPAPRPSVTGALRAAFRPTDWRGDLAALPSLLRHRSFLIPLGLMLGLAVILAITGGTELISAQLSQFFIGPQPVAAVFLAGFLAPRASYLIGALLGIIAQLIAVVLLASPAIQQSPAGASAAAFLQPDTVFFSFLVAAFFGAFYAAAAAWYKRFLALANPSRNARPTGKPADRSRRRGSDDRPLLARRR